LDRAESLFQELIQLDSFYKSQALEQLIEIYQDEKEWSKAIQAASMLSRLKGDKEPRELAVAKAHFCCELALQDIENNNLEAAAQQLQQGYCFQYPVKPAHSRSALALQDIENNNLEAAAQQLQQAVSFDENSVRESLILAELAYRQGDYQ